MIHSILLPMGYHVFEKGKNRWVKIENIPKISDCWNGRQFVKVHSKIMTQKTNVISVILDSVTCVALLPKWCEDIRVNFHCDIPAVKRTPTDNNIDYLYAAIRDFCVKLGIVDGNVLCKIPKSRLNVIAGLDNLQIIQQNKKYTILSVPNTCIIETPDNVRNSLTYINTVISLKAMKHHGSDVEIRDDGIRLESSAFRRLRRMISVCGSKSDVILRVNQLHNGRHKKMKRQLRLRKDDFDYKQSGFHNCQPMTYPAIRKSVRQLMEKDLVKHITWYIVDIFDADSLGVEGLVLLL